MNATLRWALPVLAVVPFLPVPATAQITARPVIVEVDPQTPESTHRIFVRNEGDRAQPIRVYVGDFDQMPSGNHDFMALGSQPQSCGERITVFPDGGMLEPGGEEEVVVRIEPAERVCWSMVFIESAPDDVNNLAIATRIGIKAYGVPLNAAREAVIEETDIVLDGREAALSLVMRNVGVAPLRPTGRIEVRSLGGDLIRTVDLPAFSALPDHERRYTADLGTLEPGRYAAVVILDISAPFLVGDRVEFEVP